jgi:hypothetical protein
MSELWIPPQKRERPPNAVVETRTFGCCYQDEVGKFLRLLDKAGAKLCGVVRCEDGLHTSGEFLIAYRHWELIDMEVKC